MSKIACVLFLGNEVLKVHSTLEMQNMTTCSRDFVSVTWKSTCVGMPSSEGILCFSLYLQRCMNIWLMSHILWRNLITVLRYKARPLAVNTDADSVINTEAPSESNMFWGEFLALKKRIFEKHSVICFELCSIHRLRFVKIFPVNTSSARKTSKWCLYFNDGFPQKLVVKITSKY